jgi:hypothetical protein
MKRISTSTQGRTQLYSPYPRMLSGRRRREPGWSCFPAGSRIVKLTQDATEVLGGHLTRQLVEIDKAGDQWQESGSVFCTGKGTLINPTNLRRRSFALLLQRA